MVLTVLPHSWIIKSLELFGINDKIIYFTKKALCYWKTSMRLHTERKITETEEFLISNFRRVLNVACFLLGYSRASEFCVLTFRNTLSVPSS